MVTLRICNVVKVAILRLLLIVFGSCAMQRIKLGGQREHSPNVKLAVAPERAVAGDAASRTENHALTLGSRPFGSIGDSRI